MSLAEVQRDSLLAFARLLLYWNQRINLTAAKSPDDLIAEHIPDSFAMAQLVEFNARVVDVGSGGGLPGIPFALLRPDCPVTLIEARAKRAAFLRTALRELGVANATVISRRMESVTELRHAFDGASSRATFPPTEWLARARSLLVPGGRALAFTTPAELARIPDRLAARIDYVIRGSAKRVVGAFDVPRET